MQYNKTHAWWRETFLQNYLDDGIFFIAENISINIYNYLLTKTYFQNRQFGLSIDNT